MSRCMITTLDLDEDVLTAANEMAHQRGQSLDEAISLLVRLAVSQSPGRGSTPICFRDLPRFPVNAGSRPVSSEIVRHLLLEESA